MSIVKNQHYVAQGYLRSFADDSERLFAFDKKSGNPFPTTIRNVASEKFFYDLPPAAGDSGGDPQAIEKFLAKTVDADFPQAIKALLDGVEQQGRIDSGLKAPMGCFLAVQLMRTRFQRNLLTQMSELLAGELQRRGVEAGSALDPERFRLDEKGAAAVQAHFFLDPRAVGQFATVLGRHIWTVGISTKGRAFYTSDNPVVRKANSSHPVLSMDGLASLGIEIAFPLTSKYILLLYERTFFGEKIAKYDLQAIEFDERGVAYCNTMQVLGSRRQVYCPVNDFDLARDVCAMYPEACNPDRVTVKIVSGSKPTAEE